MASNSNSGDNTAVDSLLDAISLHFDSADLKSRLKRCNTSATQQWKDKHGFDLAHYCILENNIVALVLLLNNGLFKPPYEPSTWPYLHLVACMGLKSFISTVVQEIKYQNDPVALDWSTFYGHIQKKIHDFVPKLEAAERSKRHTPVDTAALFNNTACVRLLLDFWQVQQTRNNRRRSSSRADHGTPSLYLSLACKVNSPHALRALLKEDPDKKEALECAMRMSAPECVDIVLRDGGMADMMSGVFQGMNLFHVLYSYSSCSSVRQYEAMVEITSILLRHGQDVNTVRPSRTLPLHSLLSHRGAGCSMEQRGPFLLAALLLLLKAGADPNVDEVLIEGRLRDAEHSTAFGRSPHASAAHCLLAAIPALKANAFEDALVTDPVDNYCYKCLELLLRHGANLAYVGDFKAPLDGSQLPPICYSRGTVLHALLSMRSLVFINYPVLRLLLRYGVDADAGGACYIPFLPLKFSYALNVLPFTLWSLHLGGHPSWGGGAGAGAGSGGDARPDKTSKLTERDLKHFLYVMRFMSQPALVLAYREFTAALEGLRSHAADTAEPARLSALRGELLETANPVMAELVREYERATREPWLLQRCCAHTVWVACRQHMGNIYSLPIPGPLRRVILNFY